MRFQALTDLYMADGSYVQVGSVFDAPPGWKPVTHGCNPLDQDAVSAYWQQGPCFSAVEPFRACFTNSGRWTGVPVPGPSTFWIRSGNGYILSGAGSNLGVKPALPT
jgi:hypothetical protein